MHTRSYIQEWLEERLSLDEEAQILAPSSFKELRKVNGAGIWDKPPSGLESHILLAAEGPDPSVERTSAVLGTSDVRKIINTFALISVPKFLHLE